ncbi:MAG TPA: hypothetical protein VL092_04125, partial [Chitinophagaceae bacterium]|nr:hypothetical protein [Chitinophagaceae bacterium]
FEQYEISNFAAQQRYAVHNTNYWKGVPYLGIGPSAHSFDGENRRSNVANNSRYIRSILQGKKLDFEVEKLSENQRLNEYIMTSLRTKWGCDLQMVEQKWGASGVLKKASQPFLEQNWLSLDKDVLLLTNTGKLFADHIASELFVV